MIDVIIIGDHYLDVNLTYAKKNKDIINKLYVLADCMEAEITTHISKINRVGMPDGRWSFFRVFGGFGDTINQIVCQGKTHVVVLDEESSHGIFEKLRKERADAIENFRF